MAKPIFFEIDFDKGSLITETVQQKLFLPQFPYPKKFEVKGENCFCAGYFVSYNLLISISDLVKSFKEKDWEFFKEIIGSFIIFFYDERLQQFFVLTDSAGKFPCYFFLDKKRLVLSSHFGMVKNALKDFTIDTDLVFDAINWSLNISTKTFISEIKQVPPLTLLTIDFANFNYSFLPITDLDEILRRPVNKYDSSFCFINNFIEIFGKIIQERLRTVGNLNFASEISSGFDANLICYLLKKFSSKPFYCYSGIAEKLKADTDPQVTIEFAKKHGLNLKFTRQDEVFPFSNDEYLGRNKNNPFEWGGELMFDFHNKLSKDGVEIKFTGNGGDEIYESYNFGIIGKFALQEEYFSTIEKLRNGVENIFTQKGTNFLIDRDRFSKKEVYFSVFSPSVVMFNLLTFPLYWDFDIWSIDAFVDQRLVDFFRGIPFKEGKPVSKQELWKGRRDIFLPQQFVSKSGSEEQSSQFLEKKTKFIIGLLSNSVLGKFKLIRSLEIMRDLKTGNINKYKPWGSMVFLENVLKFEYFLQSNRSKIKKINIAGFRSNNCYI